MDQRAIEHCSVIPTNESLPEFGSIDRRRERCGGHPILSLSRGKTKKIIFCKNNGLQNRFDFWNTPALEFLCKCVSTSTNLSPMANSESKRYQYPVCPDEAGPPIIPYPDSKVQREALDCPPRGPSWPPRWCSGSSRRK
jgi:hypothetical protein